MGRVIAVSSGKGGVGKTTVSANLATALAKLGKQTLLVDADIAMANLGMLFGLHSAPITLHDVLIEGIDIRDAMYDGPFGLKIVPSGLTLNTYRRAEPEKLINAIASVENEFDYIVIDTPAGIGEVTRSAMASAKELLLVVTPDPASLTDAMKVRMMGETLGLKTLGVVVNMRRNEPWEAKKKDIESFLETTVLEEIPDDPEVRKSWYLKNPGPVVYRAPNSPAARAFMRLAAKISGEKVKEEKRSIIDRILSLLRR